MLTKWPRRESDPLLLLDLRWALYGAVYRFALKRNPPGRSRLISLAVLLSLQTYWLAAFILMGGMVPQSGEGSTLSAMRHGRPAIYVFLTLMALYLVDRFWIFREDHYSAFAERRARWAPSMVLWERAVAILGLLATAAVMPLCKWLLR